jgi:hypothetical protein
MRIIPVTEPFVIKGSNFAPTLQLCPGAKDTLLLQVFATPILERVKSLPTTDLVRVKLALPVFVTVTKRVALSPKETLPKSKVVFEALKAAAIATGVDETGGVDVTGDVGFATGESGALESRSALEPATSASLVETFAGPQF